MLHTLAYEKIYKAIIQLYSLASIPLFRLQFISLVEYSIVIRNGHYRWSWWWLLLMAFRRFNFSFGDSKHLLFFCSLLFPFVLPFYPSLSFIFSIDVAKRLDTKSNHLNVELYYVCLRVFHRFFGHLMFKALNCRRKHSFHNCFLSMKMNQTTKKGIKGIKSTQAPHIEYHFSVIRLSFKNCWWNF